MAMTGSGVELDGFGTQLLVNRLNQFPGLFSFDQASRRIVHDYMQTQFLDFSASLSAFGFQGDHRAPVHHIVLRDGHP